MPRAAARERKSSRRSSSASGFSAICVHARQPRNEIGQREADLRRRRARGEQQRRAFGAAAVVEIEQRMLGGCDRRRSRRRRRSRAARCRRMPGSLQPRSRATSRAAGIARCGRPSFAAAHVAIRRCVRPLPSGAGKIERDLRRFRRGALQQIERNAVVACHECVESLMRRPAQRQRQLRAHEPPGGARARRSTTMPARRSPRADASSRADDDDHRLVRRAIELARLVALVRVAQQHHDDRRDRQREQHAEKAEQLAAGEHREDHRDRMQADLLADEPRHEHVAFERLADRRTRSRRRRRACQSWYCTIAAITRHDDAGDRAEIRHEADQARDHADQRPDADADDARARRRRRRRARPSR